MTKKPTPYGIADFGRVLTEDEASTCVELLRLLDEHGFDTEDPAFEGLHGVGSFLVAAEAALECLNDEDFGVVADGAVIERSGDRLVVGRAPPSDDGRGYHMPSRSSWSAP